MGHKKICFHCRKSFNQNSDFQTQTSDNCPECGNVMTNADHKFRPPKSTDISAWKVAQFLIERGFIYQHIYSSNRHNQKENLVPYPANMREAKLFVLEYKNQALEK